MFWLLIHSVGPTPINTIRTVYDHTVILIWIWMEAYHVRHNYNGNQWKFSFIPPVIGVLYAAWNLIGAELNGTYPYKFEGLLPFGFLIVVLIGMVLASWGSYWFCFWVTNKIHTPQRSSDAKNGSQYSGISYTGS